MRGIIHVHSTFSDGSGTPPEITEAAQRAGIDFVILTDHNSSAARKDFEKPFGKSDLYCQTEVSTPAGHAVSFYSLSDARNLPDSEVVRLTYRHILGAETRNGLFVSIAHPSNIKNPWNRLDRFSDGIEVANFDSFWQRELSGSCSLGFLTTCLTYPFNNYLSALRFLEIYKKDFTTWDALTAEPKHHFAYIAHDAQRQS